LVLPFWFVLPVFWTHATTTHVCPFTVVAVYLVLRGALTRGITTAAAGSRSGLTFPFAGFLDLHFQVLCRFFAAVVRCGLLPATWFGLTPSYIPFGSPPGAAIHFCGFGLLPSRSGFTLYRWQPAFLLRFNAAARITALRCRFDAANAVYLTP